MIAPPLRCVVDASVGIKLVINEPDSPIAHQFFALLATPGAEYIIPEFFYLETGNILWKMVQRAQMPNSDAPKKLGTLEALRLTRVSDADLADAALAIAIAQGITTYDACYVAVSIQRNVPLITADARLVGKLASPPYSVHLLSNLSLSPPPATSAPPTSPTP